MWNGRNRAQWPINNKYLKKNIAYKAVVPPASKPDEKYFGIAETEFPLKSYANSTELSKYIWKWKDEKIMLYIRWNIMPIVHGFPKDGVCKLYLTDKFLL